MEYKEKKYRMVEVIENLMGDDKFDIWNEYCYETWRDEERIYTMSDIEDECYGMSVRDIIRTYGSLDVDRNYISYYPDVESGDFVDEMSVWDADALAEYIIENDNDLYCVEIRNALDEIKNEEEE